MDACYEEMNANMFSLQAQFQDDTSLSLVILDARDNGRLAIQTLRDHQISLYQQQAPCHFTLYRIMFA